MCFPLASCQCGLRSSGLNSPPQFNLDFWKIGMDSKGRADWNEDNNFYLKNSDEWGKQRLKMKLAHSGHVFKPKPSIYLQLSEGFRVSHFQNNAWTKSCCWANCCICLLFPWSKSESWGRKVNAKLRCWCVLPNILVPPMPSHPGGSNPGVNWARESVTVLFQALMATSWTRLGMYLTMKLWLSLDVTLK